MNAQRSELQLAATVALGRHALEDLSEPGHQKETSTDAGELRPFLKARGGKPMCSYSLTRRELPR